MLSKKERDNNIDQFTGHRVQTISIHLKISNSVKVHEDPGFKLSRSTIKKSVNIY